MNHRSLKILDPLLTTIQLRPCALIALVKCAPFLINKQISMTADDKPREQLRLATQTASCPLQSTIETEQIYHYCDITASCLHSN